jgi:hypothetical protein
MSPLATIDHFQILKRIEFLLSCQKIKCPTFGSQPVNAFGQGLFFIPFQDEVGELADLHGLIIG